MVIRTSARFFLFPVLVPALAIAHHGLAVFDRTSPVMLEGTVTEFHFTNPHCIIDFEVKNAQGQVEKWQAELTSPLHLKGWTATSLEPGNTVTITGYRAKSGAYYVWITQLISSNGRHLKTNGDNLIPDAP
jgi:Family of unknown function (DUF6152)